MGYFILIKKKGTKKFIGAIPAKKGATLSKLRKTLPKSINPKFEFRIVTKAKLKSIIKKTVPKKIMKKRRR